MTKAVKKIISACFLFMAASLLTSVTCLSAPINLTKDTDGWTVFTPSADSRIVYVSSDGNDDEGLVYAPSDAVVAGDPFNPAASVQAFESYDAAFAETRSGYPDWILLKRGDNFTFYFGSSIRSGRSPDEPFLIGAYGSAARSPQVRTGANQAFGTDNLQYFALFGVDFYAHTRDPDYLEYVSGDGSSGFRFVAGAGDSITGLLIEGCKFRFYRNNQVQKYQGDAIGDIHIRRCLFTDNYSESSHSQGLYSSTVNGLTLEENIFIHNGWYTQQVGGGNDQNGGQATMFNHNTYFTNATNVTFLKNMFLMASSIGTKWTANDGFLAENIILDNNLFVDGEIAISLGGNTTEALRFINPIVRNNVITNIGRSQPTDRTLGWGIDAQDWNGGLIANNLLMNQPLSVISNTYGINLIGTSRNVSISGNVLHNIRFADGINLSSSRGSNVSGMVFSENKVQIGQDAGYSIDTAYDPLGKWVFRDNMYYSDRSEENRFRMAGTRMSLSEWQAATGDNSTFEPITFADPTRNIETYQTSLGQAASIDAFFTACRAQDRFSWDSRYTADSVNSWIKVGFDLEDTEAQSPGSDPDGTSSSGGCFISAVN